jgi:hypothetical protein
MDRHFAAPGPWTLVSHATVRNALLLICALTLATVACDQQVGDASFDTRVAHPAYVTSRPQVLFDEAHHNFHTTTGRYKTFANLMTHDGCVVTPSALPFSAATLAGHDVLVIANALGAESMADSAANRPAFTDAECDAVRDWVREGGALLLIADHAPMGAAAQTLGARFGVRMFNGYTEDSGAAEPGFTSGSILRFTRENHLLADHAITRGRDSTECVSNVMTFTGQSLLGPEGSAVILALTDAAVDVRVGYGEAPNAPPSARQSAKGHAQGVAFEFGKGRVVVYGEAAMLTAQLAGSRGRQLKMGMNYPGTGNRQFALNTMHWLTRLLN